MRAVFPRQCGVDYQVAEAEFLKRSITNSLNAGIYRRRLTTAVFKHRVHFVDRCDGEHGDTSLAFTIASPDA